MVFWANDWTKCKYFDPNVAGGWCTLRNEPCEKTIYCKDFEEVDSDGD